MDLYDRVAALMVMMSITVVLLSLCGSFLAVLLLSFYLLHHLSFASALFEVVPYFMLAIGLAAIPVSIYGNCAAVSRNKWHLRGYCLMLVCLLCLQLAATFLANEFRIMLETQHLVQVLVRVLYIKYTSLRLLAGYVY